MDKSPDPSSTSDWGSGTFTVEEQLRLNTHSSEDGSADAMKLVIKRGAEVAPATAKLRSLIES